MAEGDNDSLGRQLRRKRFETKWNRDRILARSRDPSVISRFPNGIYPYGMYRSGPDSYESHFKSVLGENHLIDLIKNKPCPVVVDFLSTTDAIAGLFEQIPNKEKYGLSVSLEEDRDEETLERDRSLGISHLTGDLNDFQTWKRVHQDLAGRKADLIMERGIIGLEYLPINGRYYAYALGNMWDMLSSDNGVIIAEIPNQTRTSDAKIDIKKWTEMLQQHNIDVVYESRGRYGGAIKLVKTKKLDWSN